MTERAGAIGGWRTTWTLCGVEALERGSTDVVITHRFAKSIVAGTPQLGAVLEALAEAELDEDDITVLAAVMSDTPTAPPVDVTLRQLEHALFELAFLVERAVYADGELLIRVRPIAMDAGHLDAALPDDASVELGRFAYLRAEPGTPGFVLLSRSRSTVPSSAPRCCPYFTPRPPGPSAPTNSRRPREPPWPSS